MATILTGVSQDIELILYKFVSQTHHTFSVFSEVWKDMQFYNIFSGRSTVLEMKYFTRELLILVKLHTQPNYIMWERSGAIFLLFALYLTQPLSQKVPVRIEQREWTELCIFSEEMKSINMEVSFCFYKLIANNAFDFCFSQKPYNIEAMKDEDGRKKENLTKPQKKYKYDKFAMGALLTSIGFDPDSSALREAKYNELKLTLNEKFPDLCNFDIRRFAVNLLIPTVNTEDNRPTTPESKFKILKWSVAATGIRDCANEPPAI